MRKANVLMKIDVNSNIKDFNLIKDALGTLRHDFEGSVTKNDNLICMVGQNLYRRLGRYRATEVCQRMRLLARLLMEINKVNKKNKKKSLKTVKNIRGAQS